MTGTRRSRTPVPGVAAALVALTLAGCTSAPSPAGPTTAPAPSASPPTTAATPAASTANATPTVTEPTTTNTLPPPPAPSRPAASTAGDLDAAVLPVPRGWHRVVRAGGDEQGYQGNGTWVHARDARYAATDTVTIGCAAVTRDDFTDPVHALEGTYADAAGRPGIGLVLEFRTGGDAARYLALYRRQVAACTDPDGPVLASLITGVGSADALADHRSYPGDDRWSEVVERNGRRLTLVILADPDRRVDANAARRILAQIT